MRGVQRESPDRLHGPAELGRRAGQSSCSGATFTISPCSRPSFTRDRAALDGDGPDLAVELEAVQRARPHAERATWRAASPRPPRPPGRAGRGAQHEPRAALLHLRGRDPDVERAGVACTPARRRATSSGRGRRGCTIERGPRVAARAVGRDADDRAHEVGALVGVARAGAVAGGLQRHGGQRPVAGRRAPRRARRRSASRARRRRRRRTAARRRAARAWRAPGAGAGRGRRARSRAAWAAASRRRRRRRGSRARGRRRRPRRSRRSRRPRGSAPRRPGPRGSAPRPRRAGGTRRGRARERASGARRGRSARGSPPSRGAPARAPATTSMRAAPMPWRSVRVRMMSTPRRRNPSRTADSEAPASSSAPSSMSPATPRDRSRCRAGGSCGGGASDPRRDRARAEPVVDVHDRDAGGARRQHRQQRGVPAERRRRSRCSSAPRSPAPRPARRRPTRAPRPPAATTTQSAARRSSQRRPPAGAARRRRRPRGRRGRAQQLAAHARLAHHRRRRTSRRDDRDGAQRLRHRAPQPASRARASSSQTVDRRAARRPRCLVGARDDARCPAPPLESARDDRRDLVGPSSPRRARLGHALARPALGVDPREAEVEDREVSGHGWGV